MTVTAPLDVEALRKDFPLLTRRVHDRPIVYLDSASSALQPQVVINAMANYYETTHANVHRGVYATAEESTHLYENARLVVGRFIGAPDPAHEVVFSKNTTESINLVAHTWARANLKAGDRILLTEMEHHANLVPWLMLADEIGLEVRHIPVDGEGRLDLGDLSNLVAGAKLVGLSAMSNVLGTINPVAEIAAVAHSAGAVVVVDGAQLVPHVPIDVEALDADFLAFSGHKMMGPTGIGVLWARRELLAAMPPFLGGGGMILDVKLDSFRPAAPPARFEAGTPPIAEAVGLSTAVDYLSGIGMDRIRAHERELTAYALGRLHRQARRRLPHLRPARRRRPWRRDLPGLPRHPRARSGAGARPVRCLRAARAPLRQAAHAQTGRSGHRSSVIVPVQRRARHRSTDRGVGRSR